MTNISYFESILSTGLRASELAASGKPVVGYFCNFPPEELILAAGALPLRLDAGDTAAAEAGEALFVRDACGVVKSALGLLEEGAGLLARVDLLIIPAACDAKRKLADLLAESRPIHVLHLPTSKEQPHQQAAWLQEIRLLLARLEALTGKRVRAGDLRQAIGLLNARQEAYRSLLDLRRSKPGCITGREAMTVAAASFSDDVARWTQEVRSLVKALGASGAVSEDPSAPRVLLTGAPLIYPNFRLLELIEAAGLLVVAEEMCSGTQRFYHTAAPSEWSMPEMLRAVAERALLPCTCPCFVDSADRLRRLTELIEQDGVDGVIYHNLRTCLPFDAESLAVRKLAQTRDIPLLQLQTDYGEADSEQLRTRLEAFREVLAKRGRSVG